MYYLTIVLHNYCFFFVTICHHLATVFSTLSHFSMSNKQDDNIASLTKGIINRQQTSKNSPSPWKNVSCVTFSSLKPRLSHYHYNAQPRVAHNSDRLWSNNACMIITKATGREHRWTEEQRLISVINTKSPQKSSKSLFFFFFALWVAVVTFRA